MASASIPPSNLTPAMRQYFEAKRQHGDALVFFRMGDFYEMFYEDALTAARVLELTLTSRSKDVGGNAVPMCGVPHHAADGYITRLVKRGYRVAICEQIEDPKKAKGLVQRAVVRVVSPGTLIDAGYLDAREPAFIMAIAPGERPGGRAGSSTWPVVGTALIDLSTGEFTVAEYVGASGQLALEEDLRILRPREIVVAQSTDLAAVAPEAATLGISVTTIDPWAFGLDHATRVLTEQLRVASLDGFGLVARPLATTAAGALVHHLRETQKVDLAHVRAVHLRDYADGLLIDPVTLKHLEILEGAEGARDGSLLDHLDRTQTSMGARLLRAWLVKPLARLEPIHDRLDAVEEFAFRAHDRTKARDALRVVHDLERLLSRAALGSASPRDLSAIRQSLIAVPRLRSFLDEFQAPLVRSLLSSLDDVPELRERLTNELADEPPALARDGGVIRDGVDKELDELRDISRNGKQRIAEMEEAERQRTGISSLKIRFNRVFGYYIEVSKSNLHAVPDDYLRKQTIAGGERYITAGLKDYEDKVLGADERITEREVALFDALRVAVTREAGRIQETARAVATLDVLATLADVAATENYTKPQMHDGDEYLALDARHPVVEHRTRDPFVPNDIRLDGQANQLVILTGPNMGGKSTFLRQTALIVVLAQIGSFVPARQAKLAIVDRVFARVGASDNIARGQSTFMVEMQETARILHTATSRSLVVLDEIGRGTATFDGLSIAWAVAEFLVTNSRANPKTLFATHYHELTDLADSHQGVANFHVAVREWRDDIVFLRKVIEGRADRSYGIQVARLAGLPAAVIARAREILTALERDELSRGGRPSMHDTARPAVEQLGLFQSPPTHEHVIERLRGASIDDLTPLAALTLLAELKREVDR